jgi:hypothetical protein
MAPRTCAITYGATSRPGKRPPAHNPKLTAGLMPFRDLACISRGSLLCATIFHVCTKTSFASVARSARKPSIIRRAIRKAWYPAQDYGTPRSLAVCVTTSQSRAKVRPISDGQSKPCTESKSFFVRGKSGAPAGFGPTASRRASVLISQRALEWEPMADITRGAQFFYARSSVL